MSRYFRLCLALVILTGSTVGCTSVLPTFDSPLTSPLELPQNVAWYRMESVSMQPTLYEGDYVGVDQSAYLNRIAERGDLILFKKESAPDQIKRVIGLPGETIEVRDGKVLINGTPIDEPYLEREPNYGMEPVAIEADHIFVLGDNRPNSSDSHVWGTVPISNVIGQVVSIRSSAK